MLPVLDNLLPCIPLGMSTALALPAANGHFRGGQNMVDGSGVSYFSLGRGMIREASLSMNGANEE